MRRKGQIFLIITVLAITFLIGISTLLLDSQRAIYIDSAPDTYTSLQAWDLTYDGLVQILEIQLTIDSNLLPLTNLNINLTSQISKLENYLLSRGLSITISPTSNIDFTKTGDLTRNSSVQIIGSFYIHLASSNFEVDEDITLQLSYRAVSDLTSTVVTRTLNTNSEYIGDATLSSTTTPAAAFSNIQNGRYDHTLILNDDILIVTNEGVLIRIQLI